MKERSRIGGGGHRTTERSGNSVRTNDYSRHGAWAGGVKTNRNGEQWATRQNGTTYKKIGNDGRFR